MRAAIALAARLAGTGTEIPRRGLAARAKERPAALECPRMASPELEALWKRVVDAWDDDEPHALFLRHCQESEQLGEAASRYAGMRGDRTAVLRRKSASKR